MILSDANVNNDDLAMFLPSDGRLQATAGGCWQVTALVDFDEDQFIEYSLERWHDREFKRQYRSRCRFED